MKVPEVLFSGNHERIRRFRVREAWRKTLRHRPDLLGLRLEPEPCGKDRRVPDASDS